MNKPALLLVQNKPLSVDQSSMKLKSAKVFSLFRIPPLPCCVPCFNFPSIIMIPLTLFTIHLRFLFNWKLVWIWIMQTERKYLLNKCACELISCQDLQAGGWIKETWESAFVHHNSFLFRTRLSWMGKWMRREKVNIRCYFSCYLNKEWLQYLSLRFCSCTDF